ncbi:hypothetical protein DSECCO2_643160 [anaerobic digester metagenome]
MQKIMPKQLNMQSICCSYACHSLQAPLVWQKRMHVRWHERNDAKQLPLASWRADSGPGGAVVTSPGCGNAAKADCRRFDGASLHYRKRSGSFLCGGIDCVKKYYTNGIYNMKG